MSVSQALGEYFSGHATGPAGAALNAEMRRLLLDYLGVAVAGSKTESGRIAGDFACDMGGNGQASVIGRDARIPAVNAAFANAVAEHSLELDDVDEEALFHYGPPVVSAALAAGQQVGADGRTVLSALLAGCEMMSRLSRAANPSLRDRGFHTTPACGVFGATVAAGRLFSLNAGQMTSALGLAGAQASGLMEMYGTSMQKRINPGPAARNGVTAATLAGMGFTGAETIFEGERGFGVTFTDKFDAAQLLDGLGDSIPVLVEYKPYSAARPIHNAIDCALRIRAESGIDATDIESITVWRHPMWARYHIINGPRTYHEAQVSLPYSVAVAFSDGRALPEQYEDSRVGGDTQLADLSSRVRILADERLSRPVSCRMRVRTYDGREMSVTVDYPKGSVEDPLSDEELLAKFSYLTRPVLGADKSGRLADAALAVESIGDINGLLALTH